MDKPIINISCDIEDIFGDQDLLNDLLFELLQFCEDNEIKIDAYISGIKNSILKDFDSLMLLLRNSKYIKVGYHSNTHSFRTIPEQNSISKLKEIEEYKFDIHNDVFLKEEGGIKDFLNYHKTDKFRCPGFCWTPDYFEYMKHFNMRYTTLGVDYSKVFEYKNIIVVPTMPKPLEKIQEIDELKECIRDKEIASIFFHPSRLVYNHYWDRLVQNSYKVIKDRDVYIDSRIRVERLKQLLLDIKNSFTTINVNDVYLTSYSSNSNEKEQLLVKLVENMKDKWQWSQVIRPIDEKYHIQKLYDSVSEIKIGEYEIR